jgi:glutamyl-tRNA reductase
MIEVPTLFEKKFYVVGISFKRTDTKHRNQFSISGEQRLKAYQQGSSSLDHFLILSTCNRTEIYGFAPCEHILEEFMQSLSGASREEVSENSYIKKGDEAVTHLLTVAAGLDSQIPGDYEIIGQIRHAFRASKSSGRSNGFIERVVSQANQVSKAIKNTTSFSDGTVSISYSVARQIGTIMKEQTLNKVCIVGLGKIGLNTLKYLRQRAPTAMITIVNRNEQKLFAIAESFNLPFFPFAGLSEAVKGCEIIVMATSVDKPVLYLDQLRNTRVRFVFDLSMPHNVADDVYDCDAITVMDVDQISAEVNRTLDRRLAEIPKVKAIVQSKAQELFDWQERRKLRTIAPDESVERKLLIGNDVIVDPKNSFPRKYACFMADQCCDGKAEVAWLPGRTRSA